MNDIPVFPKWDFKINRLDDEGDRTVYNFVFQTRLRKLNEKDGNWYYWDFYKPTKLYGGLDSNTIITLIQQNIQEVYHTILLGKVNEEIMSLHGLVLFQKCETQESEIERIKKQLKIE